MIGEEQPQALVFNPPPATTFGVHFGWTIGGLVIARMSGESVGIDVKMEGNMTIEDARALYYSLGVNIRNAEEALATAEAAETTSLER